MILVVSIILVFSAISISTANLNENLTQGLLYPRESETREVRSLDGIWNFLCSDVHDPLKGIRERWFDNELDKVAPTIPMPVPASYNDITTLEKLRDHIGIVWYDRKFFVPRTWSLDHRVWLRFGSVHYAAIVWLNGHEVTRHQIGHLPFEAEITYRLQFGTENRLTVLVDNTLVNLTIPQGSVVEEESDHGAKMVQRYSFDFFNYAGIHRTVHLYTTPKIYIDDVTIHTELKGDIGYVNYEVTVNGYKKHNIYKSTVDAFYVHTQLRNKSGDIVSHSTSKKTLKGVLIVPAVKPWWPHLMHPEPGYMYTLELYLHAADSSLLDVYRLKVGIRSLQWNATALLINNKPVYLHGFGRHEDSDIRGKGFDYSLLARDFNLLKWIGANAYRTSHYPYSEESMQFADEQGIMIIDECSAVDLEFFQPALLRNHKSAIEQLIHRDRNHPSVIMWSIANEPRSIGDKADEYFRDLANYTKLLDPKRPITAAINEDIKKDKLAQYLDIISFNRYNGWYNNAGHLDMITNTVVNEATSWHKLYNKPIIMMEYGADTLEGLHFLPTFIWSEDYQSALLSKHFKAFDILRQGQWFIGEFVWNFADFKTAQTYTRVGGNKKGLFTRNRQPKSAAYLMRQRYFALANELHQCEIPEDAFIYVVNWNSIHSRRSDNTDL